MNDEAKKDLKKVLPFNHYLQRIARKFNPSRQKLSNQPMLTTSLFWFVFITLLINIILICYTLIFLVVRMTISSIPLIDSLPLALYIFPLLVILFLVLKGFYITRNGFVGMIILIISTVMFGLLSGLVHGFLVFLFLNSAAVVVIPFIISLKPKFDIKRIGRKGVVWFVLLNLVGLLFPVSVIVMGNVPITQFTTSQSTSTITLEIPLMTETRKTINSTMISDLIDSGFGIAFHLWENESGSWRALQEWLPSLSNHAIPFTVTISTNRSDYVTISQENIGSTHLFEHVIANYRAAVANLISIMQLHNIDKGRVIVQYDMRLSSLEWSTLLAKMRAVDLVGFSTIVRNTIDVVNLSRIQELTNELIVDTKAFGFKVGTVIESFALDDYLDGDTLTMVACGLTVQTLNSLDYISVDTSRKRFSEHMMSDVGSYLVYSYSRSIGSLSSQDNRKKWGMQLELFGENNASIEMLLKDLKIARENEVYSLTIMSAQKLFELDSNAIRRISKELSSSERISITYTFRIYAFRAVFTTIDLLDPFLF